jgi:hypothetical protein
MPRDPLTEAELIADLMGPPPGEPDVVDLDELIGYAAAIAQLQHGNVEISDVRLAGTAKLHFIFGSCTVTLDRSEVLEELRPIFAELVAVLEAE